MGDVDAHVEPTVRLSNEGTCEGTVLFRLERSQLQASGTPNAAKGVAS